MPYRPYPEAGTLHALDDYELSRGYLNTRTLRWSYGAMKGRAGDDWLALMSLREPEDQVDLAARSGFGAIYLDRRGYVDAGAVDATLRRRLGPPIAQSDDGHRAVYRVPPAGTTPVPREALLLPVFGAPIAFTERPLPRGVSALSGFSGVEPTGRWTEGPLARIEFEQPLPSRFALRVDTAMAMPPSADVDLPVRIGGVVRIDAPSRRRIDGGGRVRQRSRGARDRLRHSESGVAAGAGNGPPIRGNSGSRCDR